jgi:hypothetical protein
MDDDQLAGGPLGHGVVAGDEGSPFQEVILDEGVEGEWVVHRQRDLIHDVQVTAPHVVMVPPFRPLPRSRSRISISVTGEWGL